MQGYAQIGGSSGSCVTHSQRAAQVHTHSGSVRGHLAVQEDSQQSNSMGSNDAASSHSLPLGHAQGGFEGQGDYMAAGDDSTAAAAGSGMGHPASHLYTSRMD